MTNKNYNLENAEIVIFNSPIYYDSTDDGEDYLPSLGQGYIATNLKKHSINCTLIDCVYDKLGVTEIAEIINNGNFDNIGFNVFSINATIIRDILFLISRPVNIFLGGKVVEHIWQVLFSWDVPLSITCIIGEGELILPALISDSCVEKPIFSRNLFRVFIVNKQSIYYPNNLDEIPLDRNLFAGREIINRYGRLESSIVTSRGCIYNCAFCGGARSNNPNISVRTRSIENISNEIKEILSISPNISSIRVLDDLFLKNYSSIIDSIKLFSSFPNLHWRCMAHIKSFQNSGNILHDLKSSGCDELFIGIESGSDEMRKLINKEGSIAEVIETISKIMDAGIDVKGYFICGLPEETTEQLSETVSLASTLKEISFSSLGNFRATAFRFRPYHGTQLYKKIFDSNDCDYYNIPNNIGSKKQYNFSAGNYSSVSDTAIDDAILQIAR